MNEDIKCPKCNSNNIFSGIPVEEMLKSTQQPYIEKSSCLDCDHHWSDKEVINNS